MRILPTLTAVILGAVLLPGLLQRSTAEEEKPSPPPVVSAWTSELVAPIALVEQAWWEKQVEIRRIRVFDHQLILTLRAPSPEDVATALVTLRERFEAAKRNAPGRLFSVGVSDPAARPYEVDVLVNAGALQLRAPVGEPPDSPPLSLSKNVERAAMRVSMRLKRHTPARRTIAGKVYEGLLFEHKPANAEQFLKLVHNVTVWGDPTFLVAASWDANPDQMDDERDLGPSWMELLQPTSD